jgi:predicted nucleic acid-binding protein
MTSSGQIILDTSALLAVLTSEPERAALLEATEGCALVAPASVPWEVGNALSAMLKRKRLTVAQAEKVIESYSRIPLRLIDVDLASSVEVAGRLGLYAYDAYFIVCAAVHRAPLLTLDAGLARAAKKAGIRLVEVS